MPTPIPTTPRASTCPSPTACSINSRPTRVHSPRRIFIEDQSLIGNFPGNHGIGPLTDALAIYSLFAFVDSSLNADPQTGVQKITDILKAASNKDSKSLESALDALRTLFQENHALGTPDTNAAPTPTDDRDSFYTNLFSLQNYLKNLPSYDSNTKSLGLTVESLVGQGTTALFNAAQADIATRYALYKLNPFVVRNADDLYNAINNSSGALDVYNPATSTGSLTEQYFKDRSAFLVNKIWAGTNDQTTVSADALALRNSGKQYFDDRATGYHLYLGEDRFASDVPISSLTQIVFGSENADAITGGDKWDKLYNMAGDDTLRGGKGNDYLEGGQGTDTYIYTSGDGLDTILDTDGLGSISFDGVDLNGGDLLFGETYKSTDGKYLYTLLQESTGQDLLISGMGGQIIVKDFQSGELGINLGPPRPPADYTNEIVGDPTDGDNLYGTPGNDILRGLGGYDGLSAGVGDDLLYGGEGDDTLYGDHFGEIGQYGDDTLYGEAGDDVLNGYGGDDYLDSGVGDDVLHGDYYPEDAGDDVLIAGAGRDAADGGKGMDYLDAGAGDDLLSGGAGVDILFGGDGADHLFGDRLQGVAVDSSPWDILIEDQWGENPYGELSFNYAFLFENLENLAPPISEQLGDVIDGGAGNDFIWGDGGDDYLDGGDGADYILAGNGDDWTVGGRGNDVLIGDEGEDTFVYNDGDGSDVVKAYAATAADRDVVSFGAGISADDATVSRVNNVDLQISFGNGDRMAILNWYLDPVWRLERVEFADSTVWTEGELTQLGMARYQGTLSDDVMLGDSADNGLFGLEGVDTLDGGTGVDTLDGGTGNDTYIFGRGYGQDLIIDASGIDNVQFNAGLTAVDVILTRHINDLVLRVDGSDDTLTMKNFLIESAAQVEHFVFADGSELPASQAMIDSLVRLDGTVGNDILMGTGGVDTIDGHEGDDTLDGGADNDHLLGGVGNDTYLYGYGSGNDRISDTDGDHDAIALGSGISPGDVILTRAATDLLLHLPTGETLTVEGWVENDTDKVEEIRFTDGTAWDVTKMYGITSSGSALNDYLVGTAGNDTIDGRSGDDRIYGGAGDDLLLGGSGDDRLDGGDGNNTLDGGSGNDSLLSGAGDNILRGGADDDRISILPVSGINIIDGGPGDDRTWIDWTGIGGVPGNIKENTYIVNSGSGLDTVWDWYPSQRRDTVKLGEGITPNDLIVYIGYEDLWDTTGARLAIGVGNGVGIFFQSFILRPFTGQITAEDFAVAYFEFADGSRLSTEEVLAFADGADNALSADFFDLRDGGLLALMGGDLLALRAGDNGDTLYGGPGKDYLYGGSGNDTLYGGGGNDTFDGGSGNDIYWGGDGFDIYIIKKGGGIDVIHDDAASGWGNGAVFRSGITPGSLKLSFNSLYISVGDQGDAIDIPNFDPNDVYGPHAIDFFQFADGTVLSYRQLLERGFDLSGTGGDDVISGSNVTDRINGFGGNDTLTGGEGDDVIDGGDDDDTLDAGAGNDTLIGGVGNDLLLGGAGNDTYFIRAGGGSVVISDNSGYDDIAFDAGISPDSFALSRSDNDLIVNMGSMGTLTVTDWFDGHGIERFGFNDGSQLAATQVEAQIETPNRAPEVIALIVNQAAAEDAAFSFSVPEDTFADPDRGDVLTYSAKLGGAGVLPAWLSFDPATRNFSGTPANGDVGIYELMVTATDTAGMSVDEEFILTVNNTNDVPIVANSILDQSTDEDSSFSFTLPAETFADEDSVLGDTLTLSAVLADGSVLPTWLSFDATTGTFTGTPDNGQVGSYDIQVTATDLAGTSAADVFTLTVNNINDNPVLAAALGDLDTDEDAPFSFTVPSNTFFDDDFIHGDSLSLSVTLTDGSVLPDWLSFDATTGTFTGIPDNWEVGNYDIRITATDLAGTSVFDDLVLTVNNVNDAPILANALIDQTATEDTAFNYLLASNTFHDDDAIHGDVLTYQATLTDGNALPAWLSFDASTQTFLGQAPVDSTLIGTDGDDVLVDTDVGIAGTWDINVTATDTSGISASDSFILTLQGVAGNDTLEGGKGNDVLNGGGGDDTYLYNSGDGLDQLTDSAGTDTVQFGAGFNFSNTVIRTDGGVARLRLLDACGCETEEGMDITLNSDGTSPIEAFAFADGTTYNLTDLLITSQTWYGDKKANTIITGRNDDTVYAGKGGDAVYGRTGNDTLYGEKGNDKLYGEGGNDALYGGKGDDLLNGGCGNDTLDGGKGHNTLIGGKGDDTLILGEGENTITFNLGDGHDTLISQGKEHEDNDIHFGSGITQQNLWFSRTGNDLTINILGTDDGMTLQGWYDSKHRPIEEFETSNGYELEDKKIELLVQAMASFTPTPGSGGVLPTEMPDQLQATLAAAWESN